jgi:peroxiredoxin
MKLVPGQPAPQFTAEDAFGHQIDLSAYAGRPVLLSFLRNGACAVCNLRVHKLIQQYPIYHAQGLEMVAIFESPRTSIVQYVGQQDAPFPIIPDPQATLYDLYGVESDEAKVMGNLNTPMQETLIAEADSLGFKLQREAGSNFFRLPADFLICPDQTIETAFYSEIVGEHLTFEHIENFLKALTALR